MSTTEHISARGIGRRVFTYAITSIVAGAAKSTPKYFASSTSTSMFDARRSTLDARCSMLDARRSMLDARRSTLDARRSQRLHVQNDVCHTNLFPHWSTRSVFVAEQACDRLPDRLSDRFERLLQMK